MLIQIFKSVLLMSAAGGLLALFWLCLKPVTRKLFSPEWQYYIWLTVLVVMVLPVSFSLPQKAPVIAPVQQVQNEAYTQTAAQTESQGTTDTLQKPTEASPLRRIALPQGFMRYAGSLWLLGVIFVLLSKSARYLLFLRAINKNSSVDDTLESIPKGLIVRRTKMLDAPLIVGLIRPSLYLPDETIPDSDMNYILMHELTHYKRHDLLYKWFAMLVKSLHWFNPLIYAVSKQIELDCEVSCDLAVTSRMSAKEQDNYMNMILCLLKGSKSRSIPLTTQMTSSGKTLKRRFTMIRNKKATGRLLSVLSVGIALVMLSATVLASGVMADLASDNYTIEITAGGEKAELENKPFIENNEVYVPLREVLEKSGAMEHENSYLDWSDGKIELHVAFDLERTGTAESIYDFEIGKAHLVHGLESSLMEKYAIDVLNAPILKNSCTYVPYEYIDYILNRNGNSGAWNTSYTVFDKSGNDKTIEIIQRLARPLTENEAVKLAPNYNDEHPLCYDAVHACFAELEKGSMDGMRQYCTDELASSAFSGGTFLGYSSGTAWSVYSIYLYADGNYRVVFSFYPYNIITDDNQLVLEAVMEKQSDGRFLINEIRQTAE